MALKLDIILIQIWAQELIFLFKFFKLLEILTVFGFYWNKILSIELLIFMHKEMSCVNVLLDAIDVYFLQGSLFIVPLNHISDLKLTDIFQIQRSFNLRFLLDYKGMGTIRK